MVPPMANLSLRSKIMVSLVALIVFFGGAALFQARKDMLSILRMELKQRGKAIASDLSSGSVDSLLINDLFAIYELVNSALVNNDDIRYVMVLGPDGEVLVSSFEQGIPLGLREANTLPPGATEQVKPVSTEEGIIQDIALAINSGKMGVVRVGMSETRLNTAVASYTRKLLILMGLIIVLSTGIAYGLAAFLTKSISQLVKAAKTVAQGNLSWKTTVQGSDEIGQLGTAFNAMTEQLAKSRDDLIARNKQLDLLYTELRVKDEVRGQLLNKAIYAQEEERKRLARELHDGLAQNLNAVIITLQTIEEALPQRQAMLTQRIAQCKQLTVGSVKELREMIMDLRPSMLDELGLVPAIRWYAENHLETCGVKVHVEASGVNKRLPAEIETALFRVVQEAINNIARHAQAKTTRVSLILQDSKLVVSVVDDGKGFEANQLLRTPSVSKDTGCALGLLGIQERISLLAGSFEVNSKPGAGTRIQVEVPVPNWR